MDRMDGFKKIAENEMKNIRVSDELKSKTIGRCKSSRGFNWKKALIPTGSIAAAALIVVLGMSMLSNPAKNPNIGMEGSPEVDTNHTVINQTDSPDKPLPVDPDAPVSNDGSVVAQNPGDSLPIGNDSEGQVSVGNEGTGIPINSPTDSGVASKMSPWNSGTLEQAREFMGDKLLMPSYIPEGYELTEIRVPRSEEFVGQGIRLEYSNQRYYVMISQRTDLMDDGGEGYKSVDINGITGYMRITRPEPGDNISNGYVSLEWKSGDIQYLVQGDVSEEEAIKIAKSLR